MRALALAIALATSTLIGCEQPADVVGSSIAPVDSGGNGGASGGVGGATGGMGAVSSGGMIAMESGGIGGSGGSEQKDPACSSIGIAFGFLSDVENHDCTFDPRDPQVVTLLLGHIFTKKPVSPNPEAGPPDVECNRLSDPPDFFAWARRLNEQEMQASPSLEGRWVLCPAYCAVLDQWVIDQRAALAACFIDAGI